MKTFGGKHFHSMDSKGRVSIPSRFREILKERKDNQLVLTNFKGYLLAYPHSEWLNLEAKFSEKPMFRTKWRDFMRVFMSGVELVDLDRQGRLLIPPHLRDYAKLAREVVLVGSVKCFEIWDRATFDSRFQQWEDNITEEMLDEVDI